MSSWHRRIHRDRPSQGSEILRRGTRNESAVVPHCPCPRSAHIAKSPLRDWRKSNGQLDRRADRESTSSDAAHRRRPILPRHRARCAQDSLALSKRGRSPSWQQYHAVLREYCRLVHRLPSNSAARGSVPATTDHRQTQPIESCKGAIAKKAGPAPARRVSQGPGRMLANLDLVVVIQGEVGGCPLAARCR